MAPRFLWLLCLAAERASAEWTPDQAKRLAAGRIRTSLDTLRADVPKGSSLRLLACNETIQATGRSMSNSTGGARVAAWINELLAVELGGFNAIRPGVAAAAKPRGR